MRVPDGMAVLDSAGQVMANLKPQQLQTLQHVLNALGMAS